MKKKEVTCVFEYSSFEDLERMLERLKVEIMQGKEYFEDVIYYGDNKRLLQFMQKYNKMRSFSLVENNCVTVKSNV